MGALNPAYQEAMAPLPDCFDSSLRIAVPMRLIGIRFLLGVILLVTTLFRRTAFGWVCTALTAEACGNLAGFASGSVLVLNLGNSALLASVAYTAVVPGRTHRSYAHAITLSANWPDSANRPAQQ